MSVPATRLESRAERSPAPPVPRSIEETGLTPEMIADLLLKSLYVRGARSGRSLCTDLALAFEILDGLLLDLQQRRLVQVRGARGHGRGSYVFDLTSEGRDRAREAMDSSHYVGPAPVPMEEYARWVEIQTVRRVNVRREEIAERFGHLVLTKEFQEQVGPAINSARSIFLYGDSGNGKTAIAEAIARMIGGAVYLPYAVHAEGQVILLHDPVYHRVDGAEDEGGDDRPRLRTGLDHDPRFARVQRPVVFAGGELTLSELDLRYDPHTKFYRAPFQMKANGGVLIIDDLGRQLVSVRDLLNRWIVPLEKRVDYLTLHTGHKFPVPFDCLIVFATNLDPLDLVDEAFLRRIHYKIHVTDPPEEQYGRILEACCAVRGVEYDRSAVDFVFREYYRRRGIAPRSCHPRDVVDHLCDVAKFNGVPAVLTEELLDAACHSYFLDLPTETGEGAP